MTGAQIGLVILAYLGLMVGSFCLGYFVIGPLLDNWLERRK